MKSSLFAAHCKNTMAARFHPNLPMLWIVPVLFLLAAPAPAHPAAMDFADMSLEELMEIEVTSVSKRSQELDDAAAAVYVITQEDIRHSPATSIPELLRMVPGVHVARLNASEWAISIRGFNDRFANKLLVLMDGRTLYTSVYSGVIWANHDTILQDIARIEVIRGPGASLWGSNAVNGVINIITKGAAATQESLVTVTAGTEDLTAATRYGGRLSDTLFYRAYAKAKDIDGSMDTEGDDLPDDWQMGQGGFRLDWEPGDGRSMTVQGDIFTQEAGTQEFRQSLSPPYYIPVEEDLEYVGGNLLARYQKQSPSGMGWSIQAYYDTTRSTETVLLEWQEEIADLDFQQSFSWGRRQLWTWGLGYRLYHVDTNGSGFYQLAPETTDTHLFSAFVQDEIDLVENHLTLTLGSKFEHHGDTGLAVQPSGRLLWQPSKHHTFWGGVSRAVRTPSRGEVDIVIGVVVPLQQYPGYEDSPPLLAQIYGDDDVEPEELTAFELGYRTVLSDSLSMDVAAFYNRYDDLISVEIPTGPFSVHLEPAPHILATSTVGNDLEASAHGVELSAYWRPAPSWQLQGTYSYTELDVDAETELDLIYGHDTEGKTPQHMFSLWSMWKPGEDVDVDAALRYVDRLSGIDIDAYLTGDLRLAWRPTKGLEISLAGQNLFSPEHQEFSQLIFLGKGPAEIERSAYAKLSWQF